MRYICDNPSQVESVHVETFDTLNNARNGWTSVYHSDTDTFSVWTPYTRSLRTYRRFD